MASLADTERFDIIRVVNRAFGAIGRNAPLFIGLGVAVTLIPSLLIRVFVTGAASEAARTGAVSPLASLPTLLGGSFFAIFLSFLMQAAINYATVVDLDGQRPSFGKTLGVGARFALPLLLLAIVSMFGIYLGMILLIVPGVILALMWSVATPAMVSENLGVVASLGRSRALTKGNRLSIFALFVVVGVLAFLPVMLVPLLSGAFSNPTGYAASPLGVPQLVSAVLSMLVSVLFAVIVASVYVELRTIKEGATPQSLAEIFA